MQSLPYIILAAGLCAGIALLAGGCAVAHNAWVLFILFPAALGVLLVSSLRKRIADESIDQEECLKTDGIFFLIMCCLVSLFGLIIVLNRVGKIASATAIALDSIGCICVLASCIIIQFIPDANDFTAI